MSHSTAVKGSRFVMRAIKPQNPIKPKRENHRSHILHGRIKIRIKEIKDLHEKLEMYEKHEK
jgi:hypothetical protein